MRLGLLSDIHSNLAALEVCLEALERCGCDALVCLGDIVGYGPDPRACIERVRSRCQAIVIGNHDEAVATGAGLEGFSPLAHEAALWTRAQLSEDELQFLGGLPRRAELGRLTLAHGSPESTDRYLFGVREITETLMAQETRLVACGHTHWPNVLTLREGRTHHVWDFATSRTVDWEPDAWVFINPGSVGQPRDSVPTASCGLLDTGAHSVAVLRIGYDIEATSARMEALGLPAALARRLHVGS